MLTNQLKNQLLLIVQRIVCFCCPEIFLKQHSHWIWNSIMTDHKNRFSNIQTGKFSIYYSSIFQWSYLCTFVSAYSIFSTFTSIQGMEKTAGMQIIYRDYCRQVGREVFNFPAKVFFSLWNFTLKGFKIKTNRLFSICSSIFYGRNDENPICEIQITQLIPRHSP